jgi:hypothetical protein
VLFAEKGKRGQAVFPGGIIDDTREKNLTSCLENPENDPFRNNCLVILTNLRSAGDEPFH